MTIQTATVFFFASFIKSANIPCFLASGNVTVESPLKDLEITKPIETSTAVSRSSSIHAAA